ncbi:MAG: transposase [Burkholderiales bacterium]|nr:transposase [Burkholderiales bacterium]
MNVTVSRSVEKWFVSIQTQREVEQAIPNGGAVGIDMSVARFATLSGGAFISPAHGFNLHEFSSNWKKAKTRVQKIHARIANVRRDFLHKHSTRGC